MLFKIKLQVEKANTATTRILNATAVCSAYIHSPAMTSVSIEKTNRTQNTVVVVVVVAAAAAAAAVGVVIVINPFRV